MQKHMLNCALAFLIAACAPLFSATTSAQDWTGSDWDLEANPSSSDYDRWIQDERNKANQAQSDMDTAKTALAQEKLRAWIDALVNAEANPTAANRTAANTARTAYFNALGGDSEQLRQLAAWTDALQKKNLAELTIATLEIERERGRTDLISDITSCLQKDANGNPRFTSLKTNCVAGAENTKPTSTGLWNTSNGFLHHRRVTLFQPQLATINAHHAYAWGLTGEGVKIGIEDDGVNYRLSEFEGRVSFVGAELLHWLDHDHDTRYSQARTCYNSSSPTNCHVFEYDGLDPSLTANDVTLETLNARAIIVQHGWAPPDPNTAARYNFYPVTDDNGDRWTPPHTTWYVRHEHACTDDNGAQDTCYYFSILPHAGTHGTAVASIAAGRDFGVAPGATIIPIAKDFSPEGQAADAKATAALFAEATYSSPAARAAADRRFADYTRKFYANFDIINRSYGIPVDAYNKSAVGLLIEAEDIRVLFPMTWRAIFQTDTHPDDRTILVYAAGNDSRGHSSVESDIPFYTTLARGHHLSVMAIGADGLHADFTNFCGRLPDNWDATRWGRHFCLAAPGEVNVAHPFDNRWIDRGIQGTSFAAPMVSGALALLMERFRGEMGNTDIAIRLVNTANNTGVYADSEIYGAGLLDLKAALNPVGEATITAPGGTAHPIGATFISLPPTLGNLGGRFAERGAEVAALDQMGFPFWHSPEGMMMASAPAVPFDRIGSTFSHGEPLAAGFAAGYAAAFPFQPGLNLIAGDGRFGVEALPKSGWLWGVIADQASWMGGRPSGAFGSSSQSQAVWVGRIATFDLPGGWTLEGRATLALAHPDIPSGGMLQADPHMLSAWKATLERNGSGLSFEQPMRAETGAATLRYLAGFQTEEGRRGERRYATTKAPLRPDGRELRVAAFATIPTSAGTLRGEVARVFDSLHRRDRDLWEWRVAWSSKR